MTRTRTETLLAELIALPSVNPAFAQSSTAKMNSGEKNVADFLAATAGRAGLDVEFQKVLPGRPNLLVRLLPPNRVTQTIVLAPHLDTVGGEATQFVPQWKNGRIYGRGACDTKGSVAAMLMALREVAESPARPQSSEIIFAGLVDEEHAQAGSRALAASGLKADLAIVGEPTKLQVVTAHKGSLWLELETRGKAAHGATPEHGQNAVHEMSRIVDYLEVIYAKQLRRQKHPLLGAATVNVGTIAGGTQPNIVPDKCRITVDRRTLPGETDAGVIREIRTHLRKEHLRATVRSLKLASAPALETNADLPLIRQFFGIARQSGPVGVHYFCDAAILSAGGIPSIVFGPGDIAQAHTRDEWLSLAQLERAKNLLVRFLKSLS